MSDSPPPPASPSRLPARRLSTQQMEAVVRRAVELQAQESELGSDTGVTEDELLRIGGELGIEAAHMRRALAEVSAEHVVTEGEGGGLFGAAVVSASRAVPGNAQEIAGHIERYLLETQYLAVLRRLPDRTVYEKSSGFHVEMARVMNATRAVVGGRPAQRIGAGFDLRSARTVEVSVRPVEDGFSWVNFRVDLSNQRTAYWVGINAGVGAGAAAAAVSAAIAIAPAAALIAVPIMAASAWGTRASYHSVVKRARLHLEALLDHIERGESLLP